MDSQIQLAITSFSAGEFLRQPALSDNPANQDTYIYPQNPPGPCKTGIVSLLKAFDCQSAIFKKWGIATL